MSDEKRLRAPRVLPDSSRWRMGPRKPHKKCPECRQPLYSGGACYNVECSTNDYSDRSAAARVGLGGSVVVTRRG